MANFESSFKVHYIGIWNEDAFTDDVIKQIAARSKAEKGKKVKLTLNNVGIKFTKSKIFQQSFVEFYPYEHMKAVTKNPCYGSCVMFILGGSEKKHRIIAIKCPSDSNSIYIVNRVSHYQQNYKGGDVELKKRDNGNWTLRERSAHNANMHLREIFKESQETSAVDDTTKLNGDVHHVPVLDKSKEPARTGSYIKRHDVTTRRESIVVKSDTNSGDVHVVADDGIRDAADLKALMDHVKVADVASGSRRASLMTAGQQPTDTASTSGPLILRATSKTYDSARIVNAHPNPYYDQWAAHRRVSGDFVLPARLDRKYSSGTGSVRSSMRVQFDSQPVVPVQRKTMSMRIRPVTSPPPKSSTTTIQRRIEDTYARPVIIQQQRRGSGGSFVMSRSHRPSSIHVMGGNELRVYQQHHGSETIAL